MEKLTLNELVTLTRRIGLLLHDVENWFYYAKPPELAAAIRDRAQRLMTLADAIEVAKEE